MDNQLDLLFPTEKNTSSQLWTPDELYDRINAENLNIL